MFFSAVGFFLRRFELVRSPVAVTRRIDYDTSTVTRKKTAENPQTVDQERMFPVYTASYSSRRPRRRRADRRVEPVAATLVARVQSKRLKTTGRRKFSIKIKIKVLRKKIK